MTKPKTTSMMTRAALAAAMWLAACSPKNGQQAATNDYAAMDWSDSSQPSKQSEPGVEASTLFTGEQMIWRVSLLGIELGRLSLAIGEPGTMDGEEVAVIKAQLETTAAAAVLSPLRTDLTTFVSTASAQPVYQRREVESGTDFKWIEVKLKPAAFSVNYRRRSKETDTEDQQVLPEDLPLYDANSFLMAARAWTLAPGERVSVYIFREIYVWKLQIERAGDEVVKTAMGEHPAIRFDAIGRRVTRTGEFDESMEPRKYSFWLSDDHKRLPLLLIAKTDFGDARMELTQHDKLRGG